MNSMQEPSFHVFSSSDIASFFIERSKWLKDSEASKCFKCSKSFFIFRRKHHCRKCGYIFCSDCSKFFVPDRKELPELNEKRVRLCIDCYIIFRKFFLVWKRDGGLLSDKNSYKYDDLILEEEDDDSSETSQVFKPNYFSEFSLINKNILETILLSENITNHEEWSNRLIPLLEYIIITVRTDTIRTTDLMDITEYVKIKTIIYKNNELTGIINGVVCNKTTSDRKMKTKVENPKILIINSSIDCDDKKKKVITSFESLLYKEDKKNQEIINDIKEFDPSVIIVEENINRMVHDELKKLDIVLFIKFKLSLLKRIARSVKAVIVENIKETLKNKDIKKVLGTCKTLFIKKLELIEEEQKEKISEQNLLYIDGCDPKLGVTLIISDPNKKQLKKIKKCLKKTLKICKHIQLAKSLSDIEEKFEDKMKLWKKIEIHSHGDFLNTENIDLNYSIKNEGLSYTKISLVKSNLEKYHDIFNYSVPLKELMRNSINKTNSFTNYNKFQYLSELCTPPNIQTIAYYSKEDIPLANYLLLKANKSLKICDSCKNTRYNHISFYYYGNNYIKISTEIIGRKRLLTEKNEETPKNNKTVIKWASRTSPKNPLTLFNSPRHSSNSGDYSPFSHKNLDIMQNSQRIGCKTLSSDNIHSLEIIEKKYDDISSSDFSKKGSQYKSSSNFTTYLECENCLKDLTGEIILPENYKQISFTRFLMHLFTLTFDNLIFDKLIDNFSSTCPHYFKNRIFRYDDTLIKFYVGPMNVNVIDLSYKKTDNLIYHHQFLLKTWKNNFENDVSSITKKIIFLIDLQINHFRYSHIRHDSLDKARYEGKKLSLDVNLVENFNEIREFGTSKKDYFKCLNSILQEFSNEFNLLIQSTKNLTQFYEISLFITRKLICFIDMIVIFGEQFIILKNDINLINEKFTLNSFEKNEIKEELKYFWDFETYPIEKKIKFLINLKMQRFFPKSLESLKVLENSINYVNYIKPSLKKIFSNELKSGEIEIFEINENRQEFNVSIILEKDTTQENFKVKFKPEDKLTLEKLQDELICFIDIFSGQTTGAGNEDIFPFLIDYPNTALSFILSSKKYNKEIHEENEFQNFDKLSSPEQNLFLKQLITNKEKYNFFSIQTNAIKPFFSSFSLLSESELIDEKHNMNPINISYLKEKIKIVDDISSSIRIIIHFPIQFEVIRLIKGIKLKDFIFSNCGKTKLENYDHWKSLDGLCLIKKISRKEFLNFLNFSNFYFEYIFNTIRSKKKSILNHILSVFEIQNDCNIDYYFCLENIIPNDNLNIICYELNANNIDRFVNKENNNINIFKNINFQIDRNGEPIGLNDEHKNFLDEAIENDLKFLELEMLEQYAIFVVINEKEKYIRITLTNYWKKLSEKNKDTVEYTKKFKNILKNYFMGIPNSYYCCEKKEKKIN